MNDNILHVYGQNYEHDYVLITGNKSALKHLRDVIDIALKKGKYENTDDYSDFVDGAGEEYDILIFADEIDNEIDKLPYTEFKKLSAQLFDIELAIEYEDDPQKCIEEIKKKFKGGINMPRIDWKSPEIKIALEKARAAYEQAPYREKHRAVEKEFAKYAGIWAAFHTIRQHAKEKGLWIGGRK